MPKAEIAAAFRVRRLDMARLAALKPACAWYFQSGTFSSRSNARFAFSDFCVFGLADFDGPLNAFERDPIRVEQEARA